MNNCEPSLCDQKRSYSNRSIHIAPDAWQWGESRSRFNSAVGSTHLHYNWFGMDGGTSELDSKPKETSVEERVKEEQADVPIPKSNVEPSKETKEVLNKEATDKDTREDEERKKRALSIVSKVQPKHIHSNHSRSRSRASYHSPSRSESEDSGSSRSSSYSRRRKSPSRHSSYRHHRHSRSRLSSKGRPVNTLSAVIKSAEQSKHGTLMLSLSLPASKGSTIPDFDLIEPKCAYGKDLYVGNIQEGSHPEDVVAFLNKAMLAANLNRWPGNPVLSCRVLPKFCFVSLRHEDEATNALNLDGIYYHGQRLKISPIAACRER